MSKKATEIFSKDRFQRKRKATRGFLRELRHGPTNEQTIRIANTLCWKVFNKP